MEYRKNDIVTLEIVDCGTDGEGIGKADGFTVFVKDAVIGDTVTAGQLLGTVAEPTAYYKEEGPGIYFAMTKDGIPVNPMDFLGE
jgi:6-phosphogluconate dehydrogenase (decarboxylating)